MNGPQRTACFTKGMRTVPIHFEQYTFLISYMPDTAIWPGDISGSVIREVEPEVQPEVVPELLLENRNRKLIS